MRVLIFIIIVSLITYARAQVKFFLGCSEQYDNKPNIASVLVLFRNKSGEYYLKKSKAVEYNRNYRDESSGETKYYWILTAVDTSPSEECLLTFIKYENLGFKIGKLEVFGLIEPKEEETSNTYSMKVGSKEYVFKLREEKESFYPCLFLEVYKEHKKIGEQKITQDCHISGIYRIIAFKLNSDDELDFLIHDYQVATTISEGFTILISDKGKWQVYESEYRRSVVSTREIDWENVGDEK